MKLFSTLFIAAMLFILVWLNKIRIYLKWQKKAESDSDFCFVALGICQCEEFKKEHKPCKHIYKLALDKGLIQPAAEGAE